MARFARIVVPGMPHHVTHRGNRRAEVFLRPEAEDQRLYLRFLGEYAAKARLELWAYCLMTNHVHLLVVPEAEDSLARGIGLAHRRYAAAIHRREGWDGHLWANRFYSTPLDDGHLWEAARYIENNPVAAGMTRRAADYPWSSAPAHALGAHDPLLAPGRPFPGDIPDWSAWLREPGDEQALQLLRQNTRTGRPCVNESILRRLEQQLKRSLQKQKTGPKPKNKES